MEIEKYFLNHQFFTPQTGQEDAFNSGLNAQNTNPLSAENGYGGKLISSSISSENIGDLTDFSALTTRDHIRVLHLHGRVDLPKDMVITEYDYQNLYLRSSITRRAFDESVRTLFAGNDVVFLGLGMSESDVLRPMREFMSDGQNTAKHREGVIAILKENDKQKSAARAIGLKTQYDINSILYTDDEKKVEFKKVKPLKTIIDKMIKSRRSTKAFSEHFESKLKRLAIQQTEWWQAIVSAPDGRKGQTGLVPDHKGRSLNGRYALYRKTYLVSINKTVSEPDKIPTENNLNHQLVWSRRQLLNPDIYIDKPSLPPETFIKDIKNRFENTLKYKERRAIIIAGDPGVGKGTFVSSLQENHRCLFDYDNLQIVHAFHGDPRYSSDFNSVISAFTRFVAGRLKWLQILEQHPRKRKCTETDHEHIKIAERDTFEKSVKENLLPRHQTSAMGRLSYLKSLLLEFEKLAKKHHHRLFVCLS